MDWFKLIERSGPFLSEAILKDALPSGSLEDVEPYIRKRLRSTYEEWQREVGAGAEEHGGGVAFPVCTRSHLYKPPRSHFDSVTGRLTCALPDFFRPSLPETSRGKTTRRARRPGD